MGRGTYLSSLPPDVELDLKRNGGIGGGGGNWWSVFVYIYVYLCVCVCVCEAAAAAPVEEEADIRNYCVTMMPNGEIDRSKSGAAAATTN